MKKNNLENTRNVLIRQISKLEEELESKRGKLKIIDQALEICQNLSGARKRISKQLSLESSNGNGKTLKSCLLHIIEDYKGEFSKKDVFNRFKQWYPDKTINLFYISTVLNRLLGSADSPIELVRRGKGRRLSFYQNRKQKAIN